MMNISMFRTAGCFLLAGLLGLTQGAVAQDVAPDVLAKKVTDEVLTILRADKDIQAGNTRKLYDLVEAKVRELHSYELPELLMMTIAGGSEDYLDWILSETAI